MLLYWKIRFVDRRVREFKDRNLWLATETLSPEIRANVEASYELQACGRDREMIRHRRLFREQNYSPQETENLVKASAFFGCVFVHDYFEDENGDALPPSRFAEAVTGRAGAVLFPAGARAHDIAFALADKPAIDLDQTSLSPDQLTVLGCFARDVGEMVAAALFAERPAKLMIIGGPTQNPLGLPATLATAASEEEIRSFVGVFRRLYMATEPGCFQNAAAVCSAALSGHPVGAWIAGGAAECAATLERPPELFPFVQAAGQSFSLKRLIDVFIYTQYAHQPNERRFKQFSECLKAVGDDRARLTFHFLTGMWSLAHQFAHIGSHIVRFFEAYCRHHKTSVEIVASAAVAHPGIGTLEKQNDTLLRILLEKARQLGRSDWESAGCPEGGPQRFIDNALTRLNLNVSRRE